MIVQRFLAWVKTAPAHARAEAVGALGRAYLHSPMEDEERRLAEVAMAALLDDPSMDVRRSLAESLAAAKSAPRHIIMALAHDVTEVAVPVLTLSPLLTDADLVDLAASREGRAQCAIAARLRVSAPVAAALAEIASLDACVLLARNTGSALTPSIYARLAERFGAMAQMREALLQRPGLPVGVQQTLVRSLTYTLAHFATDRSWMSPERARAMAGDVCEKATIAIAEERKGADTEKLVKHLHQTGQLTPVLLLRALMDGNIDLFEASLAELSGVPRARVAALIRDRRSPAFDALYRRAGFPGTAQVAFRAAIDELKELEKPKDAISALRSKRVIAERVLQAHASTEPSELDSLLTLLRRFSSEAEREEARGLAAHFAETAGRLEAAAA